MMKEKQSVRLFPLTLICMLAFAFFFVNSTLVQAEGETDNVKVEIPTGEMEKMEVVPNPTNGSETVAEPGTAPDTSVESQTGIVQEEPVTDEANEVKAEDANVVKATDDSKETAVASSDEKKASKSFGFVTLGVMLLVLFGFILFKWKKGSKKEESES